MKISILLKLFDTSCVRKMVIPMKSKRIHVFLASFRNRYTVEEARSAVSLLVFQLIYLVLLFGTMLLCLFVDQGGRLVFYLALLGGLFGLVAAALVLNLTGRYRISTWFTLVCMVFGPWCSILLDPSVLAGDFVPLIYIGLSIQLCSILLTERITLIVSAIQLCGLIATILYSPGLRALNWPSLLAFIMFISVIGILYGFSNKRQLAKIEQQRNQLLADEARLRELSVRDPLTGLFNRRYMEETFDREIRRAVRKQQPLSVVMADIDGFKTINDNIGHVLGDHTLVKISSYLGKSIRASDVACRFGGDEFCLILPDCSLEEGIKRANALRAGIEAMAFDPDQEGIACVTLSFGVAALPEDGVTREALLSAADGELYSSKRAGRNKVNGRHPAF